MSGPRIALATTSPRVRSGIGDYARELAAALAEHAEVAVHCAEPGAGEHALDALDPRACDHVWWQLGNERAHAPLCDALERHGGVVTLHDWTLFDLACARRPELARGGAAGLWSAWREGGAADASAYLEHVRERLAWKAQPAACAEDADRFLDGWHEPERTGRWTGRRARLRLSSAGKPGAAARLELALHLPRGRELRLRAGDCASLSFVGDGGAQALALEAVLPCTLEFECRGLRPDAEQSRHGDTRELGVHLRSLVVHGATGTRNLDWTAPSRHPLPPPLAARRFQFALNRRVLAAADACFVHSGELRRRIAQVRPALPVEVVEHGAAEHEPRCTRVEARLQLGLAADAFLVATFGGLQAHKRLSVLVAAAASARRERPALQLLLAGASDAELDLQALLTRHAALPWTRLAGHVPPERIETVLRAADVCVQLRGPSTGGTSGGIQRALAARRAVVASDLAEQRELPDACVLKLPQDADEIPRLARWLVELHDDRARLARMERAADEHVRTRAAWRLVAARQLEALQRFPRRRR